MPRDVSDTPQLRDINLTSYRSETQASSLCPITADIGSRPSIIIFDIKEHRSITVASSIPPRIAAGIAALGRIDTTESEDNRKVEYQVMSRIVPNKTQSAATAGWDNSSKNEDHSALPQGMEHFSLRAEQQGEEHSSVEHSFVEPGIGTYKPSVLLRTENYLVIDKPWGVRMSGSFEGKTD